eukprot:GFUD01031963.1.p1 GENE.GFUD01031963.1~~GFUD01031963.1.p1  ORF type:complete len:321 (-),score=80.36 GFUD01031963.1:39-1001(-)
MLSRSVIHLLRSSYLHHPLTPLTCTSMLSSTPCSWLHTTTLLNAGPAGTKSELAQLRKKTGYSLSICKKALGETNNDLILAEKWLIEQAQAQGWAKAQKLQGRNTSQGLLGVKIKSNVAALVELNCETDFVARNSKFISLVDEIATVCVETVTSESDEPLVKTLITKNQVAAMTGGEGKTLADLVALNIGQIGENIALGGVTIFTAGPGVKLCGLSHPSSGSGQTEQLQVGRYASLLAYTTNPEGEVPEGLTDLTLARQVCQHIIGMAPTSLDEEKDKENSLLHQTFLLDDDLKVGQILQTCGIEILDFVRIEVGRNESE